jgi:hypothetical protein
MVLKQWKRLCLLSPATCGYSARERSRVSAQLSMPEEKGLWRQDHSLLLKRSGAFFSDSASTVARMK